MANKKGKATNPAYNYTRDQAAKIVSIYKKSGSRGILEANLPFLRQRDIRSIKRMIESLKRQFPDLIKPRKLTYSKSDLEKISKLFKTGGTKAVSQFPRFKKLTPKRVSQKISELRRRHGTQLFPRSKLGRPQTNFDKPRKFVRRPKKLLVGEFYESSGLYFLYLGGGRFLNVRFGEPQIHRLFSYGFSVLDSKISIDAILALWDIKEEELDRFFQKYKVPQEELVA